MKELKFIRPYIRRHGFKYILGIAALYIVDYLNTNIPQYTGYITDGIKNGTMDMTAVWGLILKIAGMGLLIAAGRFFWRYFVFGSSRAIEKELRNDLFAHLETLPVSFFNANKTGDLMAHFTNDLAEIRMFLGPTVVVAFDATVMLILVLYKMIRYVNLQLTIAAVIPMILITFGDCIYGKVMHHRFMAKQEAFSHLMDQTQEAISGIRVIKAFVQEKKELKAFSKVNRNSQEKNLGVVKLQALFEPLLDLVIGVSSLLTLLYGGYLAIEGTITLGQFVAFNSYIAMLVWPMIAAGECITHVSQGTASLKRIVRLFDEKTDIEDGPMVKEVAGLKGEIDLHDLSFAYPDQEEIPVLEHLDVHVRAGETLAIVGRTGSGKSTLVGLLMRLYNTRSDMIRMDGYSLCEIPLAVLRRDIAYVPQENFLFSDTLEHNIAFGAEHKTKEEIYQAAKRACIHSNIMDFPEGYDTMVGERGVTLSGGQKQRSSIARALLKDAPILILDDSLSAVDTDTEEQILQNLKEARKGKTNLIIAHRISTIQHADHILVLEDGKGAEYGTHQQLMERKGIYYQMYERQQLEKQLQQEGEDL